MLGSPDEVIVKGSEIKDLGSTINPWKPWLV